LLVGQAKADLLGETLDIRTGDDQQKFREMLALLKVEGVLAEMEKEWNDDDWGYDGERFVFYVEDVKAEYERLGQLGVKFSMPPTSMGPTTVAVFDDTCGNLIQIYQG